MASKKIDIDWRRAKKDPVYFTESLLQFKLTPYQKKLMLCKSPTVCWVASRGAGKTVIMAALAIFRCATRKNHKIVYISALERQNKIACDTIRGMISGSALASSVEDISYERIKLTNNSRIYFIPGSSSVAPRGLHPEMKYGDDQEANSIDLILDEASSIPFQTFVSSAGILTAAPPGTAQRWIVGSARGTNCEFYKEYMCGVDPDEKYTKSFTTPIDEVPFRNESYVEEQREKLPPDEFAAEFESRFMSSLNSFFGDYTEKAIAQYRLPCEPYQRGTCSDCSYSLGVDLSTSARPGSDYTVLVIVEKWWGGPMSIIEDGGYRIEHVEPRIRICEIRRFQYLSFVGLKRELEDMSRKYPRLKKLVVEPYESTQLEGILTLRETNPITGKTRRKSGEIKLELHRVNPSNPFQHELFNYMHQLLRSGALELPIGGENAKQLLLEMGDFQYKVTPAGNIVFGAVESGNAKDDCVYALAYALWGLDRRKPCGDLRASYRSERRPLRR